MVYGACSAAPADDDDDEYDDDYDGEYEQDGKPVSDYEATILFVTRIAELYESGLVEDACRECSNWIVYVFVQSVCLKT
jgi:hypothetical protein